MAATTTTLYTHRMCPFAQKTAICLQLTTTIPFQLKEVDLYGGGPSKAQLLALNPKGKVPVLQHGAIVVTESERILDYIADHWGSGEVGEGGQGEGGRKLRADDAVAERWWRATLNDELLPVGKASVLGGGRGMTADLRGVLQKCEGRLGSTPGGPSYLAGGSSVSLADVSGFPFLWRLDDEYSLSGSGYPRLAAWLDRVQGIDAFRSTVEDSWWWWW